MQRIDALLFFLGRWSTLLPFHPTLAACLWQLFLAFASAVYTSKINKIMRAAGSGYKACGLLLPLKLAKWR